MEKKQLFDLLELPLLPTPDGGVVLFRDKRTVCHLGLRGTGFQVRDIAIDQGLKPWLVTARELLLLTEKGHRELAFDIASLAAPLGGGDFYRTLIECDAESPEDRHFVLNTVKGAWLLRLTGHELRAITPSPLPFLGTCSWGRADCPRFGGMIARSPRAGHLTVQASRNPGQPAVLSLSCKSGDSPSASADVSLENLLVPANWTDSPALHALSARQIAQLIPECCVAGSGDGTRGVLLIGLLAAPDIENPLDELCSYPMNVEYLGYLMMSVERSKALDVRPFRHVIGTIKRGGLIWAYVSDNTGSGGTVGSLTRIAFDESTLGEDQQVSFEGIDPASVCTGFQPRHHPHVGFLATVEVRLHDVKRVAHYLQSDDGLAWRVVGRAGEIPEARV
jgi:hypothetical protein